MIRATQTGGLGGQTHGSTLKDSSTANRLKTIAKTPNRDSRSAYTFLIGFPSLALEVVRRCYGEPKMSDTLQFVVIVREKSLTGGERQTREPLAKPAKTPIRRLRRLH